MSVLRYILAFICFYLAGFIFAVGAIRIWLPRRLLKDGDIYFNAEMGGCEENEHSPDSLVEGKGKPKCDVCDDRGWYIWNDRGCSFRATCGCQELNSNLTRQAEKDCSVEGVVE